MKGSFPTDVWKILQVGGPARTKYEATVTQCTVDAAAQATEFPFDVLFEGYPCRLDITP